MDTYDSFTCIFSLVLPHLRNLVSTGAAGTRPSFVVGSFHGENRYGDGIQEKMKPASRLKK